MSKPPEQLTLQLASALGQADVGVWEWVPATGEVFWTRKIEEIYGFAPGEFNGSFDEVAARVYPDDLPAWREDVRACVEDGKVHDLEFRVVTKSGELRWTHAIGSAERDAEGRLLRLIGITLDITERKRQQSIISNFFDLPTSLHVIARLDGTILRTNHGWQAILGHDTAALASANLLDLIHPDDRQTMLEAMADLARSTPHPHLECRVRDRDADYRIFAWSMTVELESRLLFAVASDVSLQKAAQERLRDAAEVFANTAESVVITDADGLITDVNAAFVRTTGYSRQEAIGRRTSLLKSDRHPEAFYEQLWAELMSTGSWRGEVWNRRKNGEIYPEWLTLSRVRSDSGKTKSFISVGSDITDIKLAHERLTLQAKHDALTTLPNRTHFLEYFEQQLGYARELGARLGVVFLDLDHFKRINDSLGHAAGDALLRSVAARLRDNLIPGDLAGRISGDEFVILLRQLDPEPRIESAVQRIVDALRVPHELGRHRFTASGSFGVSLFPEHGESAEVLLARADMAMYRAKAAGRNAVRYFRPEYAVELERQVQVDEALPMALERNELSLLFQPEVNLANGNIRGVESSLHWTSPTLGAVPHREFFAAAERLNLVGELSEWALQETCAHARRWRGRGQNATRIIVTVPGIELVSAAFPDLLMETLQRNAILAGDLEIQLAEDNGPVDLEEILPQLHALRRLGVRLAIDAFDTGKLSLTALERVPVDCIKTSRALTEEVAGETQDDRPGEPKGRALLRGIVLLGAALDLEVVAKGVETEAQDALLRQYGCTAAQGGLYAGLADAAQIEAALADGVLRG
jgi:diguanylate cyclase (GGDEF)-like protein/PAS domain S-box-containing protein